MPKLIDIVANLASYDLELTVYAVQPWTCDSDAVVVREPEEGGIPSEVESSGAVYFMEVFVAKEFLEDWVATEDRKVSDREKCERLIHYAVYDA